MGGSDIYFFAQRNRPAILPLPLLLRCCPEITLEPTVLRPAAVLRPEAVAWTWTDRPRTMALIFAMRVEKGTVNVF